MQIGEVKYAFFRNVTLFTLAIVGGTVLLTVILCRNREWIVRHYRQMSVTDWFVYGYCLVVMLSYLCSAYKEDALWGTEGWYMGVMSQMMFVLLYFCFSRYFGYSVVHKCLGIWLPAAGGVFLLGICNRYSVYPITMEGQTEAFISTLGNINWFCGYWSVTAPLGIALYWCSEKRIARILLGIYSFIAMLSGVTQGSNSAYLVFIVLFIALFILSLRSQKLYRFLELCMIFEVACQTGRLMQFLPGLSFNYWGSEGDAGFGITAWLLKSNGTVWIFLFLLGIYVLLRVLEKRGYFHVLHIESTEWHRPLRGVIIAIGVAGIIAIVCGVILSYMMRNGIIYFREASETAEWKGYTETLGIAKQEDYTEASGIAEREAHIETYKTTERGKHVEVVFDEDWGNGRGAAWNCGLDAYRSMNSLHKVVGIGPDCFADYIYDVPMLAERTVDNFGNMRLTNAHNEWLTILVNTGTLGLFCYVGIVLTAFVRYLRKAGDRPLLYVCAIALLAYTAHNMVSFQQVLNTPYIFIVLGIGEGLRRFRRAES